jgi:DNA-binding winged helix-turn-helix (wHTH) protein
LQQLWDAQNHTLSKEDVRQDVIEDEDATDDAIRNCVTRARKELENVKFPYVISSLPRKGYRLIATVTM